MYANLFSPHPHPIRLSPPAPHTHSISFHTSHHNALWAKLSRMIVFLKSFTTKTKENNNNKSGTSFVFKEYRDNEGTHGVKKCDLPFAILMNLVRSRAFTSTHHAHVCMIPE